MTRRVDPKRKQTIWTTTPRYARSIMLFQFFLILLMGSWLCLEYTHNVYLQSYLKNNLQVSPTILQAGIPGFLAAASGALYAKLRKTRQELDLIETEITAEQSTSNILQDPLSSLPQLEAVAPPLEFTYNSRRPSRSRRRTGHLSRLSDIEKIPYEG